MKRGKHGRSRKSSPKLSLKGTTSAHVVLIPKFVDLSATKPRGPAPAFSDRELVVLLEWTVKSAAGTPVWFETMGGSAVRRSGNIFTGERWRITEDALKYLIEVSAHKMPDATKIRRLPLG